MTDSQPLVSIVIPTHDRREDVLRAVGSCLAQTYRPLEVLVFDDASSDGTTEALRRAYPQITVARSETNEERLALRNRAYFNSQAKYVLTLDDDCYFASRDTVAGAVDLFERNASAAAVGLALVEPTRPIARGLEAKRGDRLATFLAGANLLRRSTVVELGGYREFLVRYEEERDLALRLLDRGWDILYAGGAPLVHMRSTTFRDQAGILLYSVRNTLLIWYLNLPALLVIPAIAKSSLNLLAYRFSFRSLPLKLKGILFGLWSCARFARHRKAISRQAYRLFRTLPKHGPESWNGTARPPAAHETGT